MLNPTPPAAGDKPGKPLKPYPDFPLYAHVTRRWAKKIRGKLHYFGPWDDWKGALNKYQEQRDDLHAGRKPRASGEGVTVRDLLNRFLTSKKLLADAGEITPRTFADYRETCERIRQGFGLTRVVSDLRPDDFEALRASLTKKWGPVAVGNEIARVRIVFKYAFDSELIDKPVRYGQAFKRPNKKVLRKNKTAKGKRLFEAAELRSLLAAAGVQMKAMILLGVNCGFGNTDCGTLPLQALDLDRGWINFPRPKTGIERRAPLWPETVAALRDAVAARPAPKSEAASSLVFVTKYGGSWSKDSRDNPISKETSKLLIEAGVRRPGLNFYALRHTFETVGGASRDQAAVDHIMGHARDDMASVYREEVGDDRLRAVADHVRKWLFLEPVETQTVKA